VRWLLLSDRAAVGVVTSQRFASRSDAMAKRAANRKKVEAMCFKSTCNIWLFARLKSEPQKETYNLRCPEHGETFRVKDTALSLRLIPIEWSKSAKRPPRPEK
jgi:hypothetical protein